MNENFKFEVLHVDKQTGARLGRLHTPHGDIDTPVYMPVGTQATVKAMTPRDVEETGASILLSNTYHLYLRPGHRLVEQAGGLHKFMHWDRPILTDSGGFQVFSLAKKGDIHEDGVLFRYRYAVKAMDRTHRWAERCREVHTRPDQALFGIVQGCVYEDLRIESAKTLASMDFPGYGIGGLSVGEPKEKMYEMLDAIRPYMPENKPRYLMGVGSPDCLIEGILRGVDMFDCVLQTRAARNGLALTRKGRIMLRNQTYAEDFSPIEEGCDCYACRNFSRAYIRHLIKAEEILSGTLITMHNIRFSVRLMADIRRAIAEDRFGDFAKELLEVKLF